MKQHQYNSYKMLLSLTQQLYQRSILIIPQFEIKTKVKWIKTGQHNTDTKLKWANKVKTTPIPKENIEYIIKMNRNQQGMTWMDSMWYILWNKSNRLNLHRLYSYQSESLTFYSRSSTSCHYICHLTFHRCNSVTLIDHLWRNSLTLSYVVPWL